MFFDLSFLEHFDINFGRTAASLSLSDIVDLVSVLCWMLLVVLDVLCGRRFDFRIFWSRFLYSF